MCIFYMQCALKRGGVLIPSSQISTWLFWTPWLILSITHLYYCNKLHVRLPWKTTWRLQLVQNAAAPLLLNKSCISTILDMLHWLLIGFLSQFKILFLTYKVLHGLDPGDWQNCLSHIEQSFWPISICPLPWFQEVRRAKFYRQCFGW